MKRLFIVAISTLLSMSIFISCNKKDTSTNNSQPTKENNISTEDTNNNSTDNTEETDENIIDSTQITESSLDIDVLFAETFSENTNIDKLTSITKDFSNKFTTAFDLYAKNYTLLNIPSEFDTTTDENRKSISYDIIAEFDVDNITNDNSLQSASSQLSFSNDGSSYTIIDNFEFMVNADQDLVLTTDCKNFIKSIISDDDYSSIEKTLLDLNSTLKETKISKTVDLISDNDHKLVLSVYPPDDLCTYSSFSLYHEVTKSI